MGYYVFGVNINRAKDAKHMMTNVGLRKVWHSVYTHHLGSPLFGRHFLLVILRNNMENKL